MADGPPADRQSALALAAYPARTHDKLRYADTDRQGHINNAVFATLLETGRVELLRDPAQPLGDQGTEWVLAHLELDFLGELTWPGVVDIGTRVARVGRTSVRFEQGIFQAGRRMASAETVIVQVDAAGAGARPLSSQATARFTQLHV